MAACCRPRGYEEFFSEKAARRSGRRYRKKGLDATARRLVEFLRERGIEGQTVLEIGGGVGAIQLELLKAGAARAVNVELSPGYEESAIELAREAGVEDRIDHRLGDFVQQAGELETADVVVMHKVVCCYPDYDALVGAAADRSRHRLVISFPRNVWWMRLAIRLGNLYCRARRLDFRAYLHRPPAIVAAATRRGLRSVANEEGFVWQVAALERWR
jgi:2-polyprenyl-3-methyl-5-hydroxy-6-metoxy-1,4-benzoquinol methylase